MIVAARVDQQVRLPPAIPLLAAHGQCVAVPVPSQAFHDDIVWTEGQSKLAVPETVFLEEHDLIER